MMIRAMKILEEIKKGNWKKKDFWSRLWWDIQWWMWTSSPIYVNTFDFRCLYRDWKPWKKYFHRPSIRYKMHWYDRWTRIFRLELKPLQWKSKCYSSVHEADPSMHLTIFGHNWIWEVSPVYVKYNFVASVAFYETLLWLNNNRYRYDRAAEMIYDAILENTWGDDKKPVNCYNMLTRHGRLLYDIAEHSVNINEKRNNL